MARTTAASNPFCYERPLERSDLLGRDEQVRQLVRYAQDRRVVSLAAPRRYGKTSLLRAAGQILTDEHDFVVAHVDLLGLAGPEDFVARFGSAWRRAVAGHRTLRRQLERVVGGLSSIGVTLLGQGVQLTRRDTSGAGVLPALHTLLDLPGDAGRPVLVVLDEFQALHAAWPDGEGVLRSHSQAPEQAGQVAYALAGSEPSLLAAAFEERGRAYYQQAVRLTLGRLPDAALADGIAARFERTGRDSGVALVPLLTLAAGHPQRAMLLAHLLWDRTPAGGRADDDAWEATLEAARRLTTDEATAIWESLSPAQRAALRAVVRAGSPTNGSAERSRTSRQRAGETLRHRGLIEPADRPGPRGGTSYRPVDPLLGDWVDRHSR